MQFSVLVVPDGGLHQVRLSSMTAGPEGARDAPRPRTLSMSGVGLWRWERRWESQPPLMIRSMTRENAPPLRCGLAASAPDGRKPAHLYDDDLDHQPAIRAGPERP